MITAASSNYLVNNALTFRDRRQSGRQLIRGLLKFLLVASLPALANVGLATSFYTLIQAHTLWAQLAGIVVVYVWNYAASSRTSGTQPTWLPIGLGSLLRLVQIWMPVLGVHSWRHGHGRHFSLAGTLIWLPQVDWGGQCHTGRHPLVSASTAVGSPLGGSLSVLCSALTLAGDAPAGVGVEVDLVGPGDCCISGRQP